MKAKARLTIGGGRDFDNGRVSDNNQIFYYIRICIFAYGISRDCLARDASTKRSADPKKIKQYYIKHIKQITFNDIYNDICFLLRSNVYLILHARIKLLGKLNVASIVFAAINNNNKIVRIVDSIYHTNM